MTKPADSVLAPNIDLSSLSPSALEELGKAIEKEKKAARARELDAVKTKIKKVLDDAGLAVADLAHLFPAVGRARPSAPVYRHPSKPSLTWSGKGRRPAWITDYEATGGSLDSLKVT
ncbi:H-NS family nucleoid-associated regulatory protein [Xanthomonas albilineans]|uniref:DNA-binding protein H-NS-like C-terminal domain-containing protein n=1 Tax=Xanthomonas albilineans (strain GPE PC73 / CFBP 7063) TaxID=380358 RepID=D6CKC1_XANAP|nr:H-NS histone family protein [Xanthomonas albilineans]CAZ15910.1 hypothetical protein XALp_3191 [Xanthomonas albilineans]